MQDTGKLMLSRPPFHMAGIVPVHFYERNEDFKFPWQDTLMPIAPNYMAIEHAVYECAMLACDSIWIVAGDDVQPLIKHRIGNCVRDPTCNRWESTERIIPVYYCPMNAHDRGIRDSHGWAALHGCYVANKIASRISKWTEPNMFYISWPFGIYDVKKLRPYRQVIRDRIKKQNSILKYKGSSVVNGEYLGFTISWAEAQRLRNRVWNLGTLGTHPQQKPTASPATWIRGINIPAGESWSARWFDLDDIFDDLNTDGFNEIEIDEYYKIEDWESYVNCLNEAEFLKREERVFKTIKLKGIAGKIN